MDDMISFSWWQSLPWLPWRIVATVDAADEIPEHLPRNGAVLVGSDKYPKWLVLDCPCRQGHRIMVTLDNRSKPHWRITGNRRLTLLPSVDAYTGRRRCHFIVRDGRIIWVHERA
jgi:hypothetical protein